MVGSGGTFEVIELARLHGQRIVVLTSVCQRYRCVD